MAPAAINNDIPPSIGTQGGGQQVGPPGGGGGWAIQIDVIPKMKILIMINLIRIMLKLSNVNI